MRVKHPRPAAPEVPDEMFVDPRMLKVLADKQDQGLAFYGECVYPPWKRQRKTAGGAKALSRLQLAQLSSQYVSPMMPPDTRKPTKPKATGKKERRESNKGPFTQEENAIILLEKEKGSSWEKIANSLICRTAWIVKKHYNNNLLPQTQQPKPQQPVPAAPEGAALPPVPKKRGPGRPRKSEGNAPPPASTPSDVPTQSIDPSAASTAIVLKHGLYNKIVKVENKTAFYYVLQYTEETDMCNSLVPLMEDGVFSHQPRKGRKRFRLVPEGSEAEELADVPGKLCTVVPSEAVVDTTDADKEEWDLRVT